MARGRKAALSLEEQAEKITEEIERMERSLKELKSSKKELENQLRQARLSKLDELISEKGWSLDEVTQLLTR